MQNIDSLINDGVLVLNKDSSKGMKKTVIVLGVARGGTTMVASVLQGLGVYMGEKLGAVLEDMELSKAVESNDIQRLNSIIDHRNNQHSIWGWKRPAAIDYVDVWFRSFRNVHIIAVFRDPFAIANRNRISMQSDMFKAMVNAVEQLNKLVNSVFSIECPILLCSYEKVLLSPGTFVKAVDEFLGLNDKDKHLDAMQRINPASKDYLDASRLKLSMGRLDTATMQTCSGWAFQTGAPDSPAKVEVFVNNQLTYVADAKMLRQDVKDQGIHFTGYCGFRFNWPDSIEVKEGDLVSARVKGDIENLGGSPRQVRGNKQQGTAENPTHQSVVVARKRVVHEPLPGFYCIGGQKAGTTWLHKLLSTHPDIHLPECKEVHYWDLYEHRGAQWYKQYFVDDRINGDITPAYALLTKDIIDDIHSLTPDARIILSMRHPIDRAWSYVQMEIERELKDYPEDLLAGNPTGETLDFVREKLFHRDTLLRSYYAQTIRRWRKYFGHDGVMCYRYERISQDPRLLLKEICSHIRVNPAWVDTLSDEAITRRVFASNVIPFPCDLREEFRKLSDPFIDDLEMLLGESFSEWRK